MSTIWIEKQEKWGNQTKKDFVIVQGTKEKMHCFYWDSGLLKTETDCWESKIFKNCFIKLSQKQRDVLQQFYDNDGVEYHAHDIQWEFFEIKNNRRGFRDVEAFNTLNFLLRNYLIGKTRDGLYYFTKQAVESKKT